MTPKEASEQSNKNRDDSAKHFIKLVKEQIKKEVARGSKCASMTTLLNKDVMERAAELLREEGWDARIVYGDWATNKTPYIKVTW